jgi:2,3-dihydroxy-p-cumate/2,3-dihydroxybenzoate 3,4-dioxygenase
MRWRALRIVRMSEPNMCAAMEFCLAPVSSTALPFVPTVAKIQRLGHVVFLHTLLGDRLVHARVLGFAPSDDIEGVICSCVHRRPLPPRYRRPGALYTACITWTSWCPVDDIGIAINRFKRHEVPIVFGPGRHIASNSVFLYFLDPDGLTLEYSYGMEEFAEHSPRPARTLPPVPQSIDSWGGIRDPRMSAAGLVQPYTVGRGWLERKVA